MKKKLLSFILLLLAGITAAYAYDFSAVAPTGQTLYYTITSSGSSPTVSLTCPNSSYPYWSGYTKPTGSLTIPSTVTNGGITYAVTSIGNDAFMWCSDLTSVTIPNSVTSIGENAFYWCSGLTSLSIPNSVTSIGNTAFYCCSGLTSLSIPNSVTSIGYYAFYSCGLTSVSIPNSVTSIGNFAFEACTGLTSLTIPNSVTSIGDGAFLGCYGLTSIIVTSGNTAYDSRGNCNAIIHSATNTLVTGCQNTTIPNSVTSIEDGAFAYCRNLTSVTIPNSVTSIKSGAFSYCSHLTSLTIGNSVTSIAEFAFGFCFSLTSITLPNSVTTIGHGAFYNCSNLNNISVLNDNPPTISSVLNDNPLSIDSITFYQVPSNCTITVPCNRVAVYRASDWGSWFSNIVDNCCSIGLSDLPYTDNFDHYTTSTTAKTGVQPDCWTLAHQYVTMTNEYKPMIYYGSSTAHSGNYSLILNKRGIYAMPKFNGNVSTLQLSFYLKQSQTKYQLQVGVMSNLNDPLFLCHRGNT